jgi:hypothetical protein
MVGGTDPEVDDLLAQWCSVFPGYFKTPEDAAAFRVVEDDIFGALAGDRVRS